MKWVISEENFAKAVIALIEGVMPEGVQITSDHIATLSSFIVLGMEIAGQHPEWAAAMVDLAAEGNTARTDANKIIEGIVSKYPATLDKEAHG